MFLTNFDSAWHSAPPGSQRRWVLPACTFLPSLVFYHIIIVYLGHRWYILYYTQYMYYLNDLRTSRVCLAGTSTWSLLTSSSSNFCHSVWLVSFSWGHTICHVSDVKCPSNICVQKYPDGSSTVNGHFFHEQHWPICLRGESLNLIRTQGAYENRDIFASLDIAACSGKISPNLFDRKHHDAEKMVKRIG